MEISIPRSLDSQDYEMVLASSLNKAEPAGIFGSVRKPYGSHKGSLLGEVKLVDHRDKVIKKSVVTKDGFFCWAMAHVSFQISLPHALALGAFELRFHTWAHALPTMTTCWSSLNLASPASSSYCSSRTRSYQWWTSIKNFEKALEKHPELAESHRDLAFSPLQVSLQKPSAQRQGLGTDYCFSLACFASSRKLSMGKITGLKFELIVSVLMKLRT